MKAFTTITKFGASNFFSDLKEVFDYQGFFYSLK